MGKFKELTEYPKTEATKEQVERMFQRYIFASRYSEGKNVLEIGFGSGIGATYLCDFCNKYVGIDLDDDNVKYALANIPDKGKHRISLKKMDAHNLMFEDNSFDLVLMFETLYYFRDFKKVLGEVSRILKNRGILVVGTVNKEWKDFHPSPLANKYYSCPEMALLMENYINSIKFYGGFKIVKNFTNNIISFVKKIAMKLHLIPKTLHYRMFLKKIFMGQTTFLPSQIDENIVKYNKPQSIEIKNNEDYKIIYAVATKK